MRAVLACLIFAASAAAQESPRPWEIGGQWEVYLDLQQKALASKTPIVVGVGVPPTFPKEFFACRCDVFPDSAAPALIVGVPKSGKLFRIDLPASASVLEIKRAVARFRGEVQATPAFFREHADDETEGRGPWPDGLVFPPEMKRYRRARFTQSIAVVNERDSIALTPRTALEEKWSVPGGLAGNYDGWRSDLYRYVPSEPDNWVGNIAVLNSFGHFQNNRGWLRRYPNGTFFADVLSKDGTVFEVRYREKEDGAWVSHVAYRNRAARPFGYLGLKTRQCASCHDQAGTGGYGTGLVPGGDGVLSDPFPGLER